MTGKIRTDLAVEQHENLGSGELQGVRADAYETRGYEIERVDILDERGAESLCKPIGSYLTISARALTDRRQDSFQNGAETLAGLIRSLLPQPGGLTLVGGLGNASMTPCVLPFFGSPSPGPPSCPSFHLHFSPSCS